MQFAHNGYYKGSIPFGLNFRVFGRVRFMALVLKTSTLKGREFKSHNIRIYI